MGRAIIKQPNGLLAAFSSFTDQFTIVDMTPEDYIEIRIEEAKEQAKREAEAVLKDVEEHGTSAWRKPFDLTWEEANELHEEHAGEPLSETVKRWTKEVP